MNKRILIIAPQPFFTERGTPINAREMLRALSTEGYDIDFLTYPIGEDIKINNINILRSLNIFLIKNVPIGPSFKKIILDIPLFIKGAFLTLTKRYDLIHGIEEAGIFSGILGLLTNTPYIFDVDSSMSDQLKQSNFIKNKFLLSFFEKVETFFWKRAKTNLTVCSSLSEEIRKLCPTASITQIEDFPIEEDPIEEKLLDQEILNLRDKFKIPEDNKIILYAGNFESYQGIDLLLESINLSLKNSTTPHTLVLIGGEDLHIEHYKNLSKELKIEDKVVFTGKVRTKLINSLQSQADILVSPRISGTNTPLKIYGYMKSKKAIIATNISSHTQVLSADNSYLSELTKESFSTEIVKALSYDTNLVEIKTKKIEESYKLVEEKYSVNSFHKKIKTLYRSILEGSIASRTDVPPDVASSSNEYASRFSGEIGEFFLDVQKNAVLEIIKEYPVGTKVLDIGGGHCQLIDLYLEKGFDVTLYGSDERSFIRPKSLGYTESDHIHFKDGDLLNIPFTDNSFEIVSGIRLFAHVTNWRQLLNEMNRLTSSSIIFDYTLEKKSNLFSSFIFKIKKLVEKNTRPFLKQKKEDIIKELEVNNLDLKLYYPQFALPMGLHRLIKNYSFSKLTEDFFRRFNVTNKIGTLVIVGAKKKK